mgnify:CR=1 FL=1
MFDVSFLIKIVLLIWLFLCSWQDLRRQEINLVLIGVGFISLFILSLIEGELHLWERAIGVSLGMILILLNKITRGQIGLGDGLILSVTGISMGYYINSILLVYSLFIAAIFSILYISIKRVDKKKTIPYIPFVFLVSIGVIFYG